MIILCILLWFMRDSYNWPLSESFNFPALFSTLAIHVCALKSLSSWGRTTCAICDRLYGHLTSIKNCTQQWLMNDPNSRGYINISVTSKCWKINTKDTIVTDDDLKSFNRTWVCFWPWRKIILKKNKSNLLQKLD